MPTRREMRKNNFLNIYNGIYEVVKYNNRICILFKIIGASYKLVGKQQ